MTAEAPPVDVLVADDNELLREVLLDVFADDGRLRVVAAVGDAEAAVRAASRHRPAVALVDVKMPEGGGARVARELRRISPETRVVALSSHGDRASIAEMFRSGAVSYLVKGDATNGDIISTLLRVAAGELAIPSSVGYQLLDELSSQLERAHVEDAGRQERAARVRRMLAAGTANMVFQPIVDLTDGRRRGVEALARFPGPPQQGPDRWFADAEAAGLATELELLAVRSALYAHERLGGDHLAVNVSPATTADPDFHAAILDGSPGATVMEITEHAPIDDYEAFRRQVEPLRSAGVRLAVDDAGAGFASLRHILLLAPDIIKLDISLTRGIDVDRNRRAMARALISFAVETEATVVAEGIETDTELTALRDLGVVLGQGYLLGRPGPLPDPLAPAAGDHPG